MVLFCAGSKAVGLLSSRIFPAFYYRIENCVVDVVLTTHVDDFLWACTESGHAIVDRLLTKFEVGRKEKEERIRFVVSSSMSQDATFSWM